MALFQPTNVTPSTFAGLGGGVIDVADGLTVAWQVNGNSALTAYQIAVYANDENSTLKYDTGKLSDNCPFYGIDYTGNVKFFTHSITAALLSEAGITNGGEYKIIITQWWSDTESIAQTSASVFVTRTAPAVSLVNFSQEISTRNATFNAAYTQAQGDALMWARWQIAAGADGEEIIADTNNIYGTAELKTEYDGFFTGNTYSVKLTIQTVNGVQATTGWQEFAVAYAETPLAGYVQAKCIRGVGGVLLQWPEILYIQGEATGSATIGSAGLTLTEGSSVVWDEATGGQLNTGAPWTFMWQGDTATAPTTPFTLTTKSGTIAFNLGENGYKLTLDNVVLAEQALYPMARRKWLVVLTQSLIAVKTAAPIGGLYPASDLYPATDLYPKADAFDPNAYSTYTASFSTIAGAITSVKINGEQLCRFIDIEKANYTAAQVDIILNAPNYTPPADFSDKTYLYTAFKNGFAAGNITSLGEQLEGFAIYRLAEGESIVTHLADLPLTQMHLIDYSALSQTTYTYYMYAIGTSSYATSALLSSQVTPIFWNWTLLECEEDDNGRYHVVSEFKFGKNLTSGTLSNNNAPAIYETFTPYPLIQPKATNYKTGTLTSFIGEVRKGTYSDTTALRNAIAGLSASQRTMFLKSRKGDIWQIRPSDVISFETMDNSVEQAQTVTLSWAEIDTAEGASLILTEADALWPEKTAGVIE